MFGGEYAPYLIARYTKVDADRTTLYWVMSTWNPYQVVLMKTEVRAPRVWESDFWRSGLGRLGGRMFRDP
jgi:hypothetical protein